MSWQHFCNSSHHFVSCSAFHSSNWPCRNTKDCSHVLHNGHADTQKSLWALFSTLSLHTYFLQTYTASLHWALCDGSRFLCGRGESMPPKWMRVFISLPCKSLLTTCPYHLMFNYKFPGERDQGWIRVQYQLLHCHLKKAIQWPLLCPWSWDHIVSNFQGEIALICANTGLKGWVFFFQSLSLPPASCPPSWGQEQVYLAFRENSTDDLKKNPSSHQEKM